MSENPMFDKVATYLAMRRRTIKSRIASEKLAGNTYKEGCEKSALAEIEAMECALARGELSK